MRCRFCDQDADYFVAGDPLCQSCDALIREEHETWAVIVETLLPMETVKKTVITPDPPEAPHAG